MLSTAIIIMLIFFIVFVLLILTNKNLYFQLENFVPKYIFGNKN